jgi:hypothetical protein
VGGDFVVSHVITILESLRDKIIFIKNNNIEKQIRLPSWSLKIITHATMQFIVFMCLSTS